MTWCCRYYAEEVGNLLTFDLDSVADLLPGLGVTVLFSWK